MLENLFWKWSRARFLSERRDGIPPSERREPQFSPARDPQSCVNLAGLSYLFINPCQFI